MSSILIISQTYPPDAAAVGQHMSELAAGLVRRGHEVTVVSSARGYEDPSKRYKRREERDGVLLERLRASSFGKRTVLARIAGVVGFAFGVIWKLLTCDPPDLVVFSTSPPLIGVVVRVAASARRVPTAFWAMDLNPDQLLALGMIRGGSLRARILEALNRFALAGPSLVIALDQYMAKRLRARNVVRGELAIVPPWAPETIPDDAEPGESAKRFRDAHKLTDKFVVMYSGNHSPSNPLSTLLDAAVALRSRDEIQFVFVGGGHGKAEVEAYKARFDLANVHSLPYQPRESLHASLSAGDLHVVSLGTAMVGIIHPCKVYGAMAVARPVLFFGPAESHVGDLIAQGSIGVQIEHGDVASAVAAIEDLARGGAVQRDAVGVRGQQMIANGLSTAASVSRIADLLETTIAASALS